MVQQRLPFLTDFQSISTSNVPFNFIHPFARGRRGGAAAPQNRRVGRRVDSVALRTPYSTLTRSVTQMSECSSHAAAATRPASCKTP
jgi:hypothetical protein